MIMRFGTWNTRSLLEMESELIEKFQSAGFRCSDDGDDDKGRGLLDLDTGRFSIQEHGC